MKTIFLSYSSKSKNAIETLYHDLADLPDYELWIDKKLTGGQRWWDEILARIRGCDVFIFALDQNALDSEACKREYSYAHQLGKAVLPILIADNVNTNLLPAELKTLQFIDYCKPGRPEAIKLIKAIESVPKSGNLPDPLPEPPEVPISYIDELAVQVSSPTTLSFEEQASIVIKLKEKINSGNEKDEAISLLRKMKDRDDLFNKIGHQINELLKKKQKNASLTEYISSIANLVTITALLSSFSHISQSLPIEANSYLTEKLITTGIDLYKKNDYNNARNILIIPAELGNIEAQYYLANIYYNNQQTENHFITAMKWYIKSAKGGHPNAQQKLAFMLENGLGCKQKNLKEAKKWYVKAANQGNIEARSRILTLCNNILDKEILYQP